MNHTASSREWLGQTLPDDPPPTLPAPPVYTSTREVDDGRPPAPDTLAALEPWIFQPGGYSPDDSPDNDLFDSESHQPEDLRLPRVVALRKWVGAARARASARRQVAPGASRLDERAGAALQALRWGPPGAAGGAELMVAWGMCRAAATAAPFGSELRQASTRPSDAQRLTASAVHGRQVAWLDKDARCRRPFVEWTDQGLTGARTSPYRHFVVREDAHIRKPSSESLACEGAAAARLVLIAAWAAHAAAAPAGEARELRAKIFRSM